jgi:excisionase family DNA binding protein
MEITKPIEQDRLLKIPEVKARLGLGKSTIDKFIAEGRIKSLKIGRARRIAASEVARFIREGASA